MGTTPPTHSHPTRPNWSTINSHHTLQLPRNRGRHNNPFLNNLHLTLVHLTPLIPNTPINCLSLTLWQPYHRHLGFIICHHHHSTLSYQGLSRYPQRHPHILILLCYNHPTHTLQGLSYHLWLRLLNPHGRSHLRTIFPSLQ